MPDGVPVKLNGATTYYLQKGVRVKAEPDACFLVAAVPLRSVKLAACWTPFFKQLQACGPAGLTPGPGDFPERVTRSAAASFLQQLVHKGFLYLKRDIPEADLPRVSIVIPVRNRPVDIERCLTSLERLDYPRQQVEIIVVDDGSDDSTPATVRQHPVTLLQNLKQRGASYSRNRGAEHAGAELVCFLDSDCTVDRRWLRRLVSGFEDDGVAAAGGEVSAQFETSGLDRYEKACSALHMGNYARDSRHSGAFFYLPSCNFAVRKQAFTQAGGFKTDMHVGEDVDLCWRLIDRQAGIAYTPDARVFHRHRNQVWAFIRRRFDYGTSEPVLQAMHGNRIKTLPLHPTAILFWSILLAAALILPLIALGACAIFGADTAAYYRKIRKTGLNLGVFQVSVARARHYLSVLYHLASFFSRYYLVAALLAAVVYPNWISGGLILAHLGVGVVNFRVKKPALNVVSFLIFFSLEQMAYQCGVWAACVKHRFYKPVAPKIIVLPMKA